MESTTGSTNEIINILTAKSTRQDSLNSIHDNDNNDKVSRRGTVVIDKNIPDYFLQFLQDNPSRKARPSIDITNYPTLTRKDTENSLYSNQSLKSPTLNQPPHHTSISLPNETIPKQHYPFGHTTIFHNLNDSIQDFTQINRLDPLMQGSHSSSISTETKSKMSTISQLSFLSKNQTVNNEISNEESSAIYNNIPTSSPSGTINSLYLYRQETTVFHNNNESKQDNFENKQKTLLSFLQEDSSNSTFSNYSNQTNDSNDQKDYPDSNNHHNSTSTPLGLTQLERLNSVMLEMQSEGQKSGVVHNNQPLYDINEPLSKNNHTSNNNSDTFSNRTLIINENISLNSLNSQISNDQTQTISTKLENSNSPLKQPTISILAVLSITCTMLISSFTLGLLSDLRKFDTFQRFCQLAHIPLPPINISDLIVINIALGILIGGLLVAGYFTFIAKEKFVASHNQPSSYHLRSSIADRHPYRTASVFSLLTSLISIPLILPYINEALHYSSLFMDTTIATSIVIGLLILGCVAAYAFQLISSDENGYTLTLGHYWKQPVIESSHLKSSSDFKPRIIKHLKPETVSENNPSKTQ